MQLNKSFIEDIKQSLEASVFTLGDFQLSTPDTASTLLVITFIHYPEYELSVHEEIMRKEKVTSDAFSFGSKTTNYDTYQKSYVRFSPGQYKYIDKIDLYNDIGELVSYIPKWCQYIKNDLYARTPKQDLLADIRKKFEIELDGIIENPDEYFEENELSQVNDKFEELYKKIESLQEEYSITKEKLEEIKSEFSEFKKSAKSYPKGVWAKITNNKLISSLGSVLNSKEGRELLFSQVKKLLDGS